MTAIAEINETLLIACIATIVYPPMFMVAFDLFLAWTDRHMDETPSAEKTASVAPSVAAPRRERRLRGLAAEPTVLPRAMMGASYRPVETPDAAMPDLLARLDTVPSSRVAATA